MTSLHDPAREPALYRTLGVTLPPIAAYRYGAAAHSCAAPIAIVWVAALVSIAYALWAGLAGISGHAVFPLAIGVFLWGFATVWTFLVVRNVQADPSLADPGLHARRVRQQEDDHDPLDQLESRGDPH